MKQLKLLFLSGIVFSFIACKTDKKNELKSSENEETTEMIESSSSELKTESIEEEIVERIREEFRATERKLNTLEKKQTQTDAEGSLLEITGHYENDIPVKLKVIESIGHGSTTTSYYSKDGELYFIFEQSLSEASVNGPDTYSEQRIYLNNEALVQWLKKEKTVPRGSTIKMSEVANENITKSITDAKDKTMAYRKQFESYLAKIVNAPKGPTITEGRWISVDDPNSGIEITEENWNSIYTDGDNISVTSQRYQLEERIDPNSGEKSTYLTLLSAEEKYEYAVITNTDTKIELIYLDRGNTLTYKREGVTLVTFQEFPPEIDGCACYFSKTQEAFKNGDYVYADNYENKAFMAIDGTMTSFNMTEESISEDEILKKGAGEGYEFQLDLYEIGQIDETWQHQGTLTLKQNGKVVYEKKVYGECGC